MDCNEIVRKLVALAEDGLISCEEAPNGFMRYRPLDPATQGHWILFFLPKAVPYDQGDERKAPGRIN